MLNQRMVGLGTQRSVIRELFEFGKLRAAEVGAENIFDFSIGNPSVAGEKMEGSSMICPANFAPDLCRRSVSPGSLTIPVL